MMTTNSGGATGGSSGTFAPHYVWGQYEDGQTDIVGDFVTSADASIGGNVQIDSSLKVSGNLRVANNASVGKLYVDTSLFIAGNEISVSNYVRTDVTTEQTIKGNLRLKGSGNYGNRLLFGDGQYCYIHEDTDDHLLIHAANGVNIDGTLSGTTITDIYDKLQELSDLIDDVSSRVGNSSSS